MSNYTPTNNVGYESAVEAGIRSCFNYDFVITTDADGEIPIESVIEAKKKLNAGAECVLVFGIVSRFAESFVNSFFGGGFSKRYFLYVKGYKIDQIDSEFSVRQCGRGVSYRYVARKKTD